jgi:branched-chain amino acid transport system permease protein
MQNVSQSAINVGVFSFAVLVLACVPFLTSSSYTLHVLILALLFGALATSWNLVNGYTGIFTFGHQAFFGLGAYASALLSMQLGINPWLAIWLAGLLAACIGCAVSLPVLKIRSVPHIAIVTLAFAEIARITCSNLTGLTRGELGLAGIPSFPSFSLPFGRQALFDAADKTSFYYLFLLTWLATIGVTYVVLRCKLGFGLRAIRGSQLGAESVGVNLTHYKTLAFGTSAFMAGTIGALYAHYVLIITPSSVMGIDIMVQLVAITLIGGMGRLHGPTVGAFLLIVSLELLRGLGEYRMLIYGAVMIAVTLFLPSGLTGMVHFPGSIKDQPKLTKQRGN